MHLNYGSHIINEKTASSNFDEIEIVVEIVELGDFLMT